MRAKEVLEKLHITRPTLTKYVKQGLIKVDNVINGQYNYNEDSVNQLLDANWNGHKKSMTTTLNLPKSRIITRDRATIEDLTKILKDTANIFDTLIQLRVLPPVISNQINNINKRCNDILTEDDNYEE